MTLQKTPALTKQEAFEKYFGKVTQLQSYPFKCSCGSQFLHVDESIWEHLREKHKERVVTEKQKASMAARAEKLKAEQAEKKQKGKAWQAYIS